MDSRSKDNRDTRKRNKSTITPQQLIELGKLPPQAVDLEEAVLGALMLDKDALSKVIDMLSPETFYKEQHQRIYSAIHSLFHDSEAVDIMTVTQRLKKQGELELAGGAWYVTQLTNRIASSANVEVHSRLIIEQYIKREIIRNSTNTLQQAYEDTSDVFELLEIAENGLFEVSQNTIKKSYEVMRVLLGKAIEQIEQSGDQKVHGVPSGFQSVDAITGGWQKADLIILGARPSMGKCFGKGTRIMMYDGSMKNVEDIKKGDVLMGNDSTPRNVLSTTSGREMMYNIKQLHGIDYVVNESHILSLKKSKNNYYYRNGRKIKFKGNHGDVLNITVKDYLKKAERFKRDFKGYKASIEFTTKEIPIDPYFIGLWLGDGSSRCSRITNKDEEIVSYLKKYAKDSGQYISVNDSNGTRCPTYTITGGRLKQSRNNSIQAKLRKLNLLSNKHIPDIYLLNNRKNRLKLLAGLIDSDGHTNAKKYGGTIEITSKCEKLAHQIKFLCDTLGYRTSIRSKVAKIKSTGYEGIVWRVRFNGNVDEIPIKIKRKAGNKWKDRRDWKMTGIKIEARKIDTYYGFEIDGNRLFVLEDCTVVHNTALVISLARNASVDHKIPVAIFSLEMTANQLVNRFISGEVEIPSEKLRTGNFSTEDFQMLNEKISPIADAPIYIDDTPALSIFDFRAKAKRLKSQNNIGLIIIDYLQLMVAGAGGKSGNRQEEVALISRSLKAIGKEIDVPIIALAQLSRAMEQRGGNKHPQLSDLRESGGMEQDADLVMFIHRPEYYGILQDEDGNSTQGMADIIIAKHRNGRLGTARLLFIQQFTKFKEPSEIMYSSSIPENSYVTGNTNETDI